MKKENLYPDAPGWWWLVSPESVAVPVQVDYRGERRILSVCIPRPGRPLAHWWSPLKKVRGMWSGRVVPPATMSDVSATYAQSENGHDCALRGAEPYCPCWGQVTREEGPEDTYACRGHHSENPENDTGYVPEPRIPDEVLDKLNDNQP